MYLDDFMNAIKVYIVAIYNLSKWD
jgi:hypothetical protein